MVSEEKRRGETKKIGAKGGRMGRGAFYGVFNLVFNLSKKQPMVPIGNYRW